MLFNSVSFAVFFLIVAALCFTLPSSARNSWLLAASYFFYLCWNPVYITVILAITLTGYCAGLRIEPASGTRRKLWLTLSVVSNFGLLFLFKYAHFHWLLPLGLSFHTFQGVAYTCDVYQGKVPAERSLLTYALYVAFFPQMVAGPIERPGHLLPQFHQSHRFDSPRVISGLRTVVFGLIKKMVIADLAAPAVNAVYAHPRDFSSPILCLATCLFAVQIYCDFSGYSDIAVGAARILGYDLTINFRQPYFAQSIPQFWQRWHISLSTWFRDYLYIPLGGNRVSTARWIVNIVAVFLLSGLWHGANPTFVVWGALHAVFFLLGQRLPQPVSRAGRLLFTLLTSLQVTFAWIFFRAPSVGDALTIVSRLFHWQPYSQGELLRLGLPRFEMTFLLLVIPVFFFCEYLRQNPPARLQEIWHFRSFRWPAYAMAVYTVVFFGIFDRIEFIYFQF